MQVNLAVMLAPVTFLGHITSPAVAAMATMQTDQVTAHMLTQCMPDV